MHGPTCEVWRPRDPGASRRSLSGEGSPPRGPGRDAALPTRSAEQSRVRPIAHRMRETLQEGWGEWQKVCRALPCSPDTSSLGDAPPLNQTQSSPKRPGGRGVIDRTFRALPCPVVDRSRSEGFGGACVCMVNRSGPPALVSCTYFISQVCEPLHSQPDSPPQPFSMDDLRWLRDEHCFFFFFFPGVVCTDALTHAHFRGSLSFLNVIFNEFETTSSHIRLKP